MSITLLWPFEIETFLDAAILTEAIVCIPTNVAYTSDICAVFHEINCVVDIVSPLTYLRPEYSLSCSTACHPPSNISFQYVPYDMLAAISVTLNVDRI